MSDLFVSAVSVIDPNRGQITDEKGKLKAPDNIVTSANGLRALYQSVFEESLERIAIWSAIEGMLGGNAPYDQDALDNNGMGSMSNFNTLSAKALVKRTSNTYWNLTNQSERLVSFTIDYADADPDARREFAQYADILSDELTKELRKWPSFTIYNGTNCGQLVKFGYSVLLWTDERDWRPRTTQINKFFVPNQTSTDLDQLTYCFFQNSFTAQDLWEAYERVSALGGKEDPATAQIAVGKEDERYKYFWNLNALRQILLFKANSNAKPNTQYQNFFDLEQAITNSDVGLSSFFGDGIELVTCFYKEYDGKISHYMFDLYLPGQEFVYFYNRQHHSWTEAIAIYTESPENFTIHANKGVGQMIFSMAQAVNQLDCSSVDMGRYAATPLFKTNQLNSINDPQQVKLFLGQATNVGNADMLQNNMGANIQGVVELSQFLEAKLEKNNQMSGGDPTPADSNVGSISPTEARLQSFRELGLLKPQVAHYYNQKDFEYQAIVSKMLRSKKDYPGFEYADRWKKRCIKRGVPAEIFDLGSVEWGLPEHMEVRAARVAGDGSTLGEILGLEGMLQIAGDFTPKESKQFKRDWTRAMLGTDAIAKYAGDDDEAPDTSVSAGVAALENNDFAQGQGMPVTGEPKVHYMVHLSYAKQVVEARLQGAMTAIQAQQIFDVMVPHMAQTLETVRRSRFGKTFYSKQEAAWNDLKKYAILNKQNAEKEVRAQAEQQERDAAATEQVMTDAQRKDFVATKDAQRRDFESTNKMDRQNRESDQRGQLKQKEIEIKADNARLDISLKSGVERQRVEADAQLNTLEQNRELLSDLYGETIAPADIEGA